MINEINEYYLSDNNMLMNSKQLKDIFINYKKICQIIILMKL